MQIMTDNNDWIEWTGGKCPVNNRDIVDINLRGYGEFTDRVSGALMWEHSGGSADIIAYRVIENDGREG
ncbi:hypothetical protein HA43_08255 [Pantoea eucrina]|nr:hypothetical protein HA43_08255 [Pantoea eucrina]